MDALMEAGNKKAGPSTDREWFAHHMGRTRNTAMANIIFGLTGLINNAVAASDRGRFYEPIPLYYTGVWGGGWLLMTAVVYFVASSKNDRKLFKLLMFFFVLSVFCAAAMTGMGCWGMYYDLSTKWTVSGVNRPNDIIVAICGLFGFIISIIGCAGNGALLRMPLYTWEKETDDEKYDEKFAGTRQTTADLAAQQAANLPPPPPVVTAWSSVSQGKQTPPPTYSNAAYEGDTQAVRM